MLCSPHRGVGWFGGRRGIVSRASILAFVCAVAHASATPILAACTSGGVSALPAPVTTLLRGYRPGFNAPGRMAVDADGNVFVTDMNKNEVVVRAPNGRVLARAGGIEKPVSIAVAADGRRYVGASATRSVTAYGPTWQPLFQLGQGQNEFGRPTDIGIDDVTGNVYVVDAEQHLVKVYDNTGAALFSFGGQGNLDGEFSGPSAIFVDAAGGEVLVGDQYNYRVEIFDLGGNFISCLGGTQGRDQGQFNAIRGLWRDAMGRIFVLDSFNSRIQVLDRYGAFISFISDFGETPGRLRLPLDVAIDPSNRLYISSANNARLEMYGVDTYTDPESVLPATIDVQPNPLDRTNPTATVAVYIEVPGYDVQQITANTVTANGVAPNAEPVSVGDWDNDGDTDLRLEFDWTAVLATLPEEGDGTVLVLGTLGSMQIEGSRAVTVKVSTCGTAAPPCELSEADRECNQVECVEGIGCVVQPKANGTYCNDGDLCTGGDTCSDGICQAGSPFVCDDGNPCTDDSCPGPGGCVFTPNTAPCDDGDVCTTSSVCSGGACVGSDPIPCDDGNVCTDDLCDPVDGCFFADNTAACEDGNACTTADTCSGGACAGGAPLACNDGNVCTDDTCDPVDGCVFPANTAPCNDGDACSVNDQCAGGSCLPGATCVGGVRRGLAFSAASQQAVDSGAWNVTGNQLTVAMWANVTSLSPQQYPTLLSQWDQADPMNTAFVMNTGSGLGQTRMLIYADDGTLVSCNTDMAAALTTNQWHHVAATLDGTTLRCYVDGVPFGTTGAWPAGKTIRLSPHHVRLGGREDGKFLTGVLDDVRIYDRGLSAAEIQQLSHDCGGTCGNWPANLVAWWKLDEGSGSTAADSSGSGHTGTLINAPLWPASFGCCLPWPTDTPTSGVPTATATATETPTPTFTPTPNPLGTCPAGNRRGLTLNAALRQTVDAGTWGPTGDRVSVALWVKVTSLSSQPYPTLVSKWDNNDASNAAFVLNTGSGLGVARMFVYADDGTLVACDAKAAGVLATNTWYHVAATLDGTALRCYVNGAQAGTTANWPAGRTIRSSGHHVRLGGRDDGKYLSGELDDVRIYDRALSAAEVDQLYNGGGGACGDVPSGLVGWWRLDDGGGVSAADDSGLGHTGTLVNGPIWAEGYACCP